MVPVLSEILDRTERSLLLRNLKPAHSYNVTYHVSVSTILHNDYVIEENFLRLEKKFFESTNVDLFFFLIFPQKIAISQKLPARF